MFRFKRMLKRKVYPTWVSQRVQGYKAYIFLVPTDDSYYHFQVVYDGDIRYASLAYDIKFATFEEAKSAAELWVVGHTTSNNL